MDFVFSQMLPPVETGVPKHTNASSREPVGGRTRCEVAVRPKRRGSAERGRSQQLHDQRDGNPQGRRMLAVPRIKVGRGKRYARRKAAQKQCASLAWSCSNPGRDDRAKSTAWNCNTPSLVPESSQHRSRMRMPQERLPAPPKRMISLDASLANLNGWSVRVKCRGRTDQPP
jgi:hypothetical protein